MSDLSKIKWLTGFVALLIVVNVATLGSLWFRPHHPPYRTSGGLPPDMLREELNLTKEQEKQYDQLKTGHREKMDAIHKQSKELHDLFFEQLRTVQASSGTTDSLINLMAANSSENEKATFAHLTSVRKICNPEQQRHFDDMIADIMKRQGQHPPRP